jgi:hypothetical protein
MKKLYRVVVANSQEMNKAADEGYKYVGPGPKNKVVMEKDASEVPTARELANGKSFIGNFVMGNSNLSEEAKKFLVEMATTKRGPWSCRSHVTSVEEFGGKITVRMKTGEANYYL